jgi:putative tryptophan/tyrosine transport system substrate-binding protein
MLGGLVAAPLATAQSEKVLRVGSFIPERKSAIYTMLAEPFLRRMADLGYHEGKNFAFETEYVPLGSSDEAYVQAYRKLAARKVHIFFAFGLEAALKAALATTSSTPIVMVAINWDPVGKGYVRSLRSSGSNVTGVVFREVELTMKRFQLLRDSFPNLATVTVLWDRLSEDQWRETQVSAPKLGLRVHGVQFETPPYDYDKAFGAIPAEFRSAVVMLGSPRFALPERRNLPEAALRHRLPSMYVLREYVEAGGLMSYGPSYPQMVARAADYVDRVAKGAKPAEMPIEQPGTFELVINARTAKALAVSIPQQILLRADQVIT